MNKRLIMFLVTMLGMLSLVAFVAGPLGAQTPPAGTSTTGSVTAAPATATRAPTTAPTATQAAASAVATGTGGATVLPTTGHPQQSGSFNPMFLELVVLALACVGVGVAVKRRATRA